MPVTLVPLLSQIASRNQISDPASIVVSAHPNWARFLLKMVVPIHGKDGETVQIPELSNLIGILGA